MYNTNLPRVTGRGTQGPKCLIIFAKGGQIGDRRVGALIIIQQYNFTDHRHHPHQRPTMPTSDLALNMAASGIVGSSCVGLLNPLDTVRIRFQSSTTTLPGGIRAFARNIVLKEGVWRGLWLPGLGANMTAICLSTGFRLGMYPTIRDQITSSFGQTEKNALIM